MKKSCFCFFFIVLFVTTSWGQKGTIVIEWKENPGAGTVQVSPGQVTGLRAIAGRAKIKGTHFTFSASGTARLQVDMDSVRTAVGAEATCVSIKSQANSFSFFLRDVQALHPIYIPQYGVVVLPQGDVRTYDQVEKEILQQKNQTKLEQIERMPENSFAQAETKARRMSVPIWLGLSRDFRIFEISEELEDMQQNTKVVKPSNYIVGVTVPESKGQPVAYTYALGRGVGFRNNITRRLEEGVLPIYHSELQDEDVRYHTRSFVSFEHSALTPANIQGTHFLISDGHGGGRDHTETFTKQLQEQQAKTVPYREETVLYTETEIENTGSVPRYAWIKAPMPGTWMWSAPYCFDQESGFAGFDNEHIYCVCRLNGVPMPDEEMAILLQPGEKIRYSLYFPHQPLSAERARLLSEQSFENRLQECEAFWKGKLNAGARIRVPEQRIQEMIQAGLLHLDLITFGEEPTGTLAPNVGVYTPIGTESSPIIQFYASMGWNDVARRALNYFLETQQEDGKICNYNGYTVETGAALWSMGEYFRYTQDKTWASEVKDKLLKSCNYLIQWRNKSKKEELRGKGYGMIDGKVADPEDHYHQFMLNGYGYMGLSRMAEVMQAIGVPEAAALRQEADDWKHDIRESFFQSMAIAPVVPLGDGTWSPTAPPWAEAPGPRLLYQKRERFISHGTFTVADGLLGPLYLVFCEVLEPTEPAAQTLLTYHRELLYQENTAFSQPYYSRHNWMQAKTGMVKPFLNTYYNTVAGHADRQTYTFWEHYYRQSQHKTHEEANFLMETRWMLYMEDGQTLHLLRTIPRKWMEEGKEIILEGVRSYFGTLNVTVRSHVNEGYIEAVIACEPTRKPDCVTIRLPHPEGLRPVQVIGGTYDSASESVTLTAFSGQATVRLEFR